MSPSEHGTGLISTFAGLLVVLVLLLSALEVLVGLYAGSTTSALAHDAARAVAADEALRRGDPVEGVVSRADAALRSALGGLASGAVVRWRVDGDEVELRVRVRRPSFLPTGWRGVAGGRWIERTVHVRVEALR